MSAETRVEIAAHVATLTDQELAALAVLLKRIRRENWQPSHIENVTQIEMQWRRERDDEAERARQHEEESWFPQA